MSRARTIDLSGLDPVDPAALAGEDGSLLASDDGWLVGIGQALVLEARSGIRELAHLAHASLSALAASRADLGRAPVALGALPFSPDRPARLVVPRLTVFGKGDRASDAIVLDPLGDGDALGELARRGTTSARESAVDAGHEMVVSPLDEPERFRDAVGSALRAIASGSVTKVVLARRVRASRSRPFDRAAFVRTLAHGAGGLTTFAVDDFAGATPELVVERIGAAVASTPLAGSAPAASGAGGRTLLGSEKDRLEHRVVVEAIAERLCPLLARIDVPSEPRVLAAGPVVHLATPITGTLPRRSGLSALHLAAALHPTPAISGLPDSEARRLIAELEGWARHRYGGLVGWVDATGDGQFWLSIRCARVAGGCATLAAGAGIVAGSRPECELEETTLKLEAVLGALGRS